MAPVKSHDNQTDQFIRVPQEWLDDIQKELQPVEQACAVVAESLKFARIRAIHQSGTPV